MKNKNSQKIIKRSDGGTVELGELTLSDRVERLESDRLAMRNELTRLEVACGGVSMYVSRTQHNRITRLTARVKALEGRGARRK